MHSVLSVAFVTPGLSKIIGVLFYIALSHCLELGLPSSKLYVPIISLSMNSDPKNYTERLLRSIDFPVGLVAIQIGNQDTRIVNNIIASFNVTLHKNANIMKSSLTLQLYNPGSARGFNFGLHHLVDADRSSNHWVLHVNNDVAFYPGVLRHIHHSVERAIHHDTNFGVGFTSLCCGGEWSAVVFTRRLVETIGFFDENFYPAYYEDDDYAIRIHHSDYRALRFNNTPLIHGEIDGSKDYLSGLFTQLYLRPEKTDAVDNWRRSHELGMTKSVPYIQQKWGINVGDFKQKDKLDCKSLEGINSKCRTAFKTPFNDRNLNLSYWKLEEETLRRIRNS